MRGIEIRDQEGGVLSFDLVDLLGVIGEAATGSHWRCDGVEATGDAAEWLEAASDEGRCIAGAEFASRAAAIQQTVEGRFRGYRDGESAPWLELRAVDSSFWEVFSSDPGIVERLEAHFSDVRVAEREIEPPGNYS